MTKIQIDDGKSKAKNIAKSSKALKTSKTPKKIIVTEAGNIHSSVQKSTTLSRKYVKKPTIITVTEAPKPIAVTEAPKPVAVTEAPKPVAVTEAPKPIAVTEAPKPIAVKSEPTKVEEPKTEKKARVSIANKLAEKRAVAEREQAARAARIAKERAEKAARIARERAEKAARIAQEKAEKLAKKQTALKKKTEVRAAKKAVKIAPKFKKSDRAILSASAVLSNMQKHEQAEKPAAPKMAHEFKKKSKAGRIFLALICSGATVAALVAFVHFSIPDLSVRVAAIQTGIDATYPSFVPRGYNLSNVTSDKEGVVVMTFSGPDGASFTMSEEKSTWDSTALLNNYVKKTYPNDFTTLREQGITIYVRGEKASWVNGGLLYKIDATGKYLTKEQIRNIATSL